MLAVYAYYRTLIARTADRIESDRGATAVEYGLMVALIAVVIIAAVTALGNGLKDLFYQISGAIGGASGPST